MSDWQVGDLAVKVAGPCSIIPKGAVCRVLEVHPADMHGDRHPGLVLDGWCDPDLGVCDCFDANHFRKIRPDEREACEPEFVTLLKRSKRAVSA